MEVLILLVFVSLVMVTFAVGFFAWNLKGKNHHHLDQLSILPLDDRIERTEGPASSNEDGTRHEEHSVDSHRKRPAAKKMCRRADRPGAGRPVDPVAL